MTEKLQRLYNTLETIETKGKSTITMSDCLRYVEKLIFEESQKATCSEPEEEAE